ncbi:unnamed protein product [Arabis nemorensis]|uniref:F-box associated beta-propeller type 3 domain-containing protein n=1 Tax=Arabis nemorensis TaxID=586526 RepID=A0A565AYT3_9BRAS|nr:unnamed protein product [Arabis nemorensis]
MRFCLGFVGLSLGRQYVVEFVVANPVTKQEIRLPDLERRRVLKIYLAVNKTCKMLRVLAALRLLEDIIYYHVCRLDVDPATYEWDHLRQRGISDQLIASSAYDMYLRFDVINELLDFVLTPMDIDDTGYNIARNLIDYNGRLASIVRKFEYEMFSGFTMWLLDFANKNCTNRELVFSPDPKWIDYLSGKYWSCPRFSNDGEIIFATRHMPGLPFTIVFYDHEKNKMKREEIDGPEDVLPFRIGQLGHSRDFVSQHLFCATNTIP